MWDDIGEVIKTIFYFFLGVIIFATLLMVSLYLISKFPYIDILQTKSDIKDNIARIYEGSFVVLTIFMICVAALQLSNLNKTTRADFLIRIVARYTSAEIIEARAIIQRLFRNACPPGEPMPLEKQYLQHMSEGIDEIRNKTDHASCREFALLLNLLDLLEAMAYFSRRKYITVRGVDELMGNSIVFYYKIYKPWIHSRRERYNNHTDYRELEVLAAKIESNQAKEKRGKKHFITRLLNLLN